MVFYTPRKDFIMKKTGLIFGSLFAATMLAAGAVAAYNLVTDEAGAIHGHISGGEVEIPVEDGKITLSWGEGSGLLDIDEITAGEVKKAGEIILKAVHSTDKEFESYTGLLDVKLEDLTVRAEDYEGDKLVNHLKAHVMKGEAEALDKEAAAYVGVQAGVGHKGLTAVGTPEGVKYTVFVELAEDVSENYEAIKTDLVDLAVDWNKADGDQSAAFQPYLLHGEAGDPNWTKVLLEDNPENENEWYAKVTVAKDEELALCLADEDADWRNFNDLKAGIEVELGKGENDNIKFASAGTYELWIEKVKAEDAKTIWVNAFGGENPEQPEEPEQPAEVNYYVIGSFNEWDDKDDTYKMVKQEVEWAEYKLENLVLEEAAELKVFTPDLEENNWFTSVAVYEGCGYTLGEEDDNVHVAAGTYDVVFWPESESGNHIKLVNKAAEPQQPEEPEQEVVYYLVGTFNDWTEGKDYELTKVAEGPEGHYSIQKELAKDAQLKIKSGDNWFGNESTWIDCGFTLVDGNVNVTAAGTYLVHFYLNGENGNHIVLEAVQPAQE